MNIYEAQEYMGGDSLALMKALGMHKTNWNKWLERGCIPCAVQHRIEILTDGELVADTITTRGLLKRWKLDQL